MSKLRAGSLVVAALLAPVVAQAQMSGMPSHEFGVDLLAGYSKPSGGTGSFGIGTPVDVRVGFVTMGKIQPEARLNLNFSSGGGTFISFDPGLNLLFKMGEGSGMHNMMGPYLTAGADVQIVSFKPSGGNSTSGAIITINGGIGTRMGWGSASATRLEVFGAYSLKNTSLGSPNTFAVGLRAGLSFWN